MGAPPQDTRVRLTVTAKEEAGRFAAAQRTLSPGELVLAAAPYGVVLNPKFCPSALYLSSRCSTVSSSSAHTEEGGGKGNARDAKAGKVVKKGPAKHGAKSDSSSSDAAAQFTSPYQHALYSDASSPPRDGSSSSASAPRWYTTQSTWCAVCFREIQSGRWLCNRGSLAELALDVSREQENLESALTHAEAAEAGEVVGNRNGEGEDEDEVLGDTAQQAAALRKLKKPTKSSKTRKDGAVELRRRLLEKALAQREEIFYERQCQLRRREEQGEPAVRLEGWEAAVQDSGDTADSVFAGAMSGCTGCGVLCYCSAACWRAHHTSHVESGECAVLRGLYPRLMSEYYSTGVGGGASGAGGVSAALEQGGVVLPGDEALHWSRSSSEAKMLEFQSLLFGAVVLARAARAGYASHFCATPSSATTAVAESGQLQSSAAGNQESNGRDSEAAATEKSEPEVAASVPASSPSPALNTTGAGAPHAVDSVVVPKEVTQIHETRRRAGLEGTLEVLDDDAVLRSAAAEGLACSVPAEPVAVVGRDEGPQTTLFARPPRYADMAQMETNLSVISKARRSTYQRYYRAFLKRVLPVLRLLNLENQKAKSQQSNPAADVSPLSTLQVSELYFLRLCAAAQCNSFGVYDTDDSCIAFGMYPEASYFNHSCVPNLCRVMQHGGRLAAFYALRPIAAGEPLTISYTDVEEQNSAERRRNLLETYRFFCTCERCSGRAEGPVMAVGGSSSCGKSSANTAAATAVASAVFDKPLLLCAQCAIRGYLRPLPGGERDGADAAPWTMAEVSVRECTMCGARVVRAAA